jgi:hypothetical protein
LSAFDFGLPILRVAEAIAVAIEYWKIVGARRDATVHVAFRWSGVKGRRLSNWAQPERT